MMAFVWCILATTCIGIGFKLFPAYRINTFNAIVINYTVCLALGVLLDPDIDLPFSRQVLSSDWFMFDLLMGVLFIVGFNLTARSIQTTGITLTTITQRMSILLTVTYTVLFFNEHFGALEALGLLLALAAIVSINLKPGKRQEGIQGSLSPILLAVLILSSTIEILLFYVEKTGIVGNQQIAFTTHGFGVAAVVGWIAIGVRTWTTSFDITRRDVIAGTLLGLPNFFSIYLLLHMLNHGWKGALMYPMVNVSVLLLSTMVALIIFKEKLNRINWAGIAFATLSILIIAYAHNVSS